MQLAPDGMYSKGGIRVRIETSDLHLRIRALRRRVAVTPVHAMGIRVAQATASRSGTLISGDDK